MLHPQTETSASVEVQIVEPRYRWKVSQVIEPFIERATALVLMVLLFPFLGLLAFAIYIDDRKSPLFWQTRVGRDGTTFRMVKLRTMLVDANPYMVKPTDSAPVVTPIGRVVRRRGIDELPQLWNVLKGEMALIGPRPEMPFIVDQYDGIQRMRLRVKPGLSGLWQLSRVRDRMIHHHIEYDLFHIYNRSLGLDAWLFYRTVLFAFTGRATKIRLAVRRWERDSAWRRLVPKRARGIPRLERPVLSRRWVLVAAVVFVVFAVPGVVLAASARGDLVAAKNSLLQAREAISNADPQAAMVALAEAEQAFEAAHSSLNSLLVKPALLIPGIRGNLRVAQSLASSGSDLVDAGRSALDIFEALPREDGKIALPLNGGAIDVSPFVVASQESATFERHIRDAEEKVSGANGLLLLPQVASARREALETLRTIRVEGEKGIDAAGIVPALFGHGEPRTWIIAAENLAELRGRGGYLGTFGTLTAENGRLTLGEFQPTAELPHLPLELDEAPPEYRDHYRTLGGLEAWQNLAMSPNFPSGGKLLLQRMEEFAGIKADGVVSLDPFALSYLLDVIGPIEVEGIPEPLTSENLTHWVLNRIYFTYEDANDERREVLAKVADVVWKRILSGEGIDARRVVGALGRAARERHLVVYSSRPQEQEVISRLGISGEVKRTPGDYLLVIGQNMGENKDYYLKRRATYTGEIRPNGTLEARLDLEVRSLATLGSDLARYVGGSRSRIDLPEGVARTYLSVMVPAQAKLRQVLFDGVPTTDFRNRLELGRRLFATTIDVAPAETHTVTYI